MVPDSHPLPRINDILNDCTKGKFWATLDMTNFFLDPDESCSCAFDSSFYTIQAVQMAGHADGPQEFTCNSPASHHKSIGLTHRQILPHLFGQHRYLV